VDSLMRDVVRVHVTSPQGTDLWLKPRPEKSEIEAGKITNPGDVSNYPIGEWSCSPHWEGANGTLVVDGPFGGGHNKDRIDQPVRVTFREGVAEDIEGGEAAEMLRTYLESGNDDQDGAYRIAEFAVGTNGKACEGKPDAHIGSSEGEKKYGTAHIAVGNNGTFGVAPGDASYNGEAKIHCDMVLWDQVTVECEKSDGSTFKLIENGTPQGY